MSAPNVAQAQWSHHCLTCAHCFDTVELEVSCPRCGNRNNRETTSINWYLDEQYGKMTPEEWSTALGIEDLTNPVDTPDSE